MTSRAALIPAELRAMIAQGLHGMKPTSGLCAGYLQANVAILPKEHADDFEEFCLKNYRGCPLLYRSEPGQLHAAHFAPDSDIRDCLPAYEVFMNGEHKERVDNIHDIFTDDCVTFYVGCSFSFERALQEGGVPVRNIDQGTNVSMYRTTRKCDPVGPFSGHMVVSMRPIHEESVKKAIDLTAPYVLAHGAPFHVGQPEQLGIKDLGLPDYGDAVAIEEGEVPCLWACGVTCLEAVKSANIPFAITHSPGCMFVSDVMEDGLFSLVTPILQGYSQRDMEAINTLEFLIKEDLGGRNINAITLPNQLWLACIDLVKASRVIITTGFPCLVDNTPPTESDGPPGAFALARTLALLGKKVKIVVECTNADVMRAGFQAACTLCDAMRENCDIHVIETKATMPIEDRLMDSERVCEGILDEYEPDVAVAIERAGISHSNHFYTMRATCMNHLVYPLDTLFTHAESRGISTIGVGDGGNELGMGKVHDLVSSSIPRGEKIGSRVASRWLISAGVSNWGADGLAAGTAILAVSAGIATSAAVMDEKIAVDIDFVESVLKATYEAGCRDGIKPHQPMSVDGMLFEKEHVAKLKQIEETVAKALADS